MKKGDISTGTLITIILGVILVIVFIYLVFFYPKKSKLNCGLCKSEFTHWCSECATAESPWITDVEKNKELIECIDDCIAPFGISYIYESCTNLKDKCKAYIPVLDTT